MARDGRGKPPPGESSSFDLSKMSEAEVAAEMAKRMARFRDTHKRADAAAPNPDAESASAQATPPRELDPTAVARMQRALDLNARAPKPARAKARSKRRASAFGTEFKSLLAEGPNMNAAGMRPEDPVQRAMQRARAHEVDAGAAEATIEMNAEPAPTQVRANNMPSRRMRVPTRQAMRQVHHGGSRSPRRQVRAIGILVRQAASDRFAIAGVFAIAAAILVWLLIPVDHHALPEIADAPAATPPSAAAPAAPTARAATLPPAVTTVRTASASSEPARPPQPPPAVEARKTDVASLPAPPSLKPESHAPHLVARLKPVISKTAKLSAKTKPDAQESSPSKQATGNTRNPADPRTTERLLQ